MFISKLKNNLTFINYIYVYVFLMPWNFIKPQMGLLSIVLLFWWLIVGKNQEYFKNLKNFLSYKPVVLMLIFFLFCYISLLWTDDVRRGVVDTLNFYKYYWILVPIFISVLKKEEALNSLKILIASLVCYSFYVLSVYFNIINLGEGIEANPEGILAYAIVTPYMAIATLLSVFLVIYEKKMTYRIFFSLGTMTSFFALLVSNGRSGQAAFILTIIVILLLNSKSLLSVKNLIIAIIIFLGSIFLVFNMGNSQKFEKAFYEVQYYEKNEFSGSVGQRIYMWYAAVDIMSKNPIIGVGVGDHINEFIEYTKKHPSKATWLRSFHNQHLDYMVKLGIVGYILFLLPIFYLCYKLKDNKEYFMLSIAFFGVVLFDCLGDILLLMKPFNNVFLVFFLLFSIILFHHETKFKKA